MSDILSGAIRSCGEYNQLLQLTRSALTDRHPLPVLCNGLCAGASDAAVISLFEDTRDLCQGPVLILCPDEKSCQHHTQLLTRFGYRAAFFISRDLNFNNVSASHDFETERIRVLSGILSGAFDAVAVTPDTALGLTVPPYRLRENTLILDSAETADPDAVTERLVAMGYTRVEMVDSPWQFARRGGILDIYPPSGTYRMEDGTESFSPQPLRLEFFGDEIDRMALFDSESQRMTENVRHAVLPPTREVLPDAEALDAVKHVISTRFKNCRKDSAKELLLQERKALEDATALSELHFLDKYISVIYRDLPTLLDYFPDRTLVLVMGTSGVEDRLRGGANALAMEVTSMLDQEVIASKFAVYSRPASDLWAFTGGNGAVHIDNLSYGTSNRRISGLLGFRTRQIPSYADRLSMLLEDLRTYRDGRYKVAVITENEVSAKNLKERLDEEDLRSDIIRPGSNEDLLTGRIRIVYHNSLPGYELIGSKVILLSVIPDTRKTGFSLSSTTQRRKKRREGGQAILSYADLQVGDLVVHEVHGIGRYTGMETITQDGVTRDYIHIQYAGDNSLFLPVERLHLVSKYIGSDSDRQDVQLSSFGSDKWSRAKSRAKAAVKDMAKELIQLYATRMRRPGYAFPADDDYQRDFDAAFEYQETDSQLNAIDDIKQDMEKPVPMDRLLCGDVGFGKTEVALRAAYKAVLAGKQVAILVPTTILALQHFQTISARMQPFGVSVDMVSRFRTSKQIAATLRGLRRGDIDVIIGTHRLISPDVEFKDLGLLIVDEEQRFGVAQKEKIKQRAGNVDVLTLTATPIPRTLNMAMGGIRDISVLDEAPGDRLPVQTYVLPYDEQILTDAIGREMRRGGQVFWLHNDIETISSIAYRLHTLIPDARIVTAHGRMDKEELEDIWSGMIRGEIDVLVCTTIIETGVDIPNANTLIIENAYRMGLAQLHQLRGRVGRSNRRAYAYLTFPPNRALTEIAEKRLEALRDFTDFGAGFQIALRDLELRGAGNMLGSEQSGHLEAIGYDLFIKLLNRAILEEQGKPVEEEADCQVSLACDAFIPEDYVPSPTQRMALYKKMSMVENEEDQRDILDELTDRYGTPPKAAVNLVDIALVRSRGVRCGIQSIQQNGKTILLYPGTFKVDPWVETASFFPKKLRFSLSGKTCLTLTPAPGESPSRLLLSVFSQYLKTVPESSGPDT